MAMVNCTKCGKLFLQAGDKPICLECLSLAAKDYKKVHSFLKQHPGARVDEVSEKTGISETMILDFLREGRLSLRVSKSSVCQSCGVPIDKGSYCDKCS